MTEKKDWVSYRHLAVGFSLERPTTWRILAERPRGCVLILGEPEGEANGFLANVTVVVQPLSEATDLDRFHEQAFEALRGVLTDPEFVEDAQVQMGPLSARRVVANFRQGSNHLVMEQCWAITEDTAFVLSATVPRARYENVSPAIARILDSFVPYDN